VAETLTPISIPDGSFCPVAPAALVRIYTMQMEVDYPHWLCPAGAREMVDLGWTIRGNRAPPNAELTCDQHPGGGCAR
jgi:hypothetical protein